MRLGPRLALLLVAVVGFARGGLDERQRLLGLRLFPVPLVLQNVTVAKALGEIGAVVQHGYALFGMELRLSNGQEPTLSIDVPAGSTLGDALNQVLKQLPGYDYEIVSPHLIDIILNGPSRIRTTC